MSESVFETSPSRCNSAADSLEGAASPFPSQRHAPDYCTSPDSSTNTNNGGFGGESGLQTTQDGSFGSFE
jgi:hypothetical protein